MEAPSQVLVVAEEIIVVVVVEAETVPETTPTPIPTMGLQPTELLRVPNIRICLLASGTGALCTESGGGGLIFVPTPPHARGKTSLLPNLQRIRTIESLTSPALVK